MILGWLSVRIPETRTAHRGNRDLVTVARSAVPHQDSAKVESKESLSEPEQEVDWSGSEENRKEATVSTTGEVIHTAATLQENPEKTKPQSSELHKRVADWRYEGYLKSSRSAVAVLRKMRSPKQPIYVTAGKRLDGVTIKKVLPEEILVSLGEESEEIVLTTGPAFDLTDVTIPKELLEDPETAVASMFAQTIGRYMADQPNVSLEEGSSPESETEMMEALSEKNSWDPPMDGESMEDWVSRISEGFAQGNGTDDSSAEDPRNYKLSEESRLSLLGLAPGAGPAKP